jgi:recombinational DNA repair ATPase RecF
MYKILHIKAKNYKSLKDFSLDLSENKNVFVGKNDS